MPTLTTITDEARIVFDNVLDAAIGGGTPSVRLGVTGLSRAGKTVFITALVHNLVHGGRLPLFEARAGGRLTEARLMPQPDDDVPRFDYEAHVADLVDSRTWPNSTRRISELRITIDYESARVLKRTLGRGRLHLDIVDYPGEWLLDLALLRKSYVEWSAEMLAASRQLHRAELAETWHTELAGADPAGPENEETARRIAEAFTAYLQKARAHEHALSTLTPGRFLMPGDLEGSPALTFSPLDIAADHASVRHTLGAMMERRYEAYKTHVVKPFFRDHFARLDRQIVLVDVLAALNAGPKALRDLERALSDVLAAFRPGRTSWLVHADPEDRPDPVRRDQGRPPPSQRPRPARAPARMAGAPCHRARRLCRGRGAHPGARRRAGDPRSIDQARRRALPAIGGTPIAGERMGGETYDGETEIALFPGDLPEDPEVDLRCPPA